MVSPVNFLRVMRTWLFVTILAENEEPTRGTHNFAKKWREASKYYGLDGHFAGGRMSKRVLVMGGAGFIGSHLCERLVAMGDTVVCADNYFTGMRENIVHLMQSERFTAIVHDVTIPLDLVVDEIYNLACPASPVHYQADPVQTTRTSVIGAINMLDLAKRVNAKILQASTSEVYGDPTTHPQLETYWGNVNPIGPRSCYDEGKRCAETLFFDYLRQYKLRIKVARIFNTYGPRMRPDDGRVISNFIVQALSGAPITLFGDGRQTRSFCYVSDMVSGLIALMKSPDDFTGPVNLGNQHESTIAEIASTITGMTGSRSKIEHRALPVDDPRQRCPDLTMAASALQWRPVVPLSEGLRETIDYFKLILNSANVAPTSTHAPPS